MIVSSISFDGDLAGRFRRFARTPDQRALLMRNWNITAQLLIQDMNEKGRIATSAGLDGDLSAYFSRAGMASSHDEDVRKHARELRMRSGQYGLLFDHTRYPDAPAGPMDIILKRVGKGLIVKLANDAGWSLDIPIGYDTYEDGTGMFTYAVSQYYDLIDKQTKIKTRSPEQFKLEDLGREVGHCTGQGIIETDFGKMGIRIHSNLARSLFSLVAFSEPHRDNPLPSIALGLR